MIQSNYSNNSDMNIYMSSLGDILNKRAIFAWIYLGTCIITVIIFNARVTLQLHNLL